MALSTLTQKAAESTLSSAAVEPGPALATTTVAVARDAAGPALDVSIARDDELAPGEPACAVGNARSPVAGNFYGHSLDEMRELYRLGGEHRRYARSCGYRPQIDARPRRRPQIPRVADVQPLSAPEAIEATRAALAGLWVAVIEQALADLTDDDRALALEAAQWLAARGEQCSSVCEFLGIDQQALVDHAIALATKHAQGEPT